MIADAIDQTADLFAVARESTPDAQKVRERNFRAALICAVLLHASLLIGVAKHPPRTLGEEDGAEKALSIEIVTEADLKSKTTVPVDPPSPPPAPQAATPPPQAAVLPKPSIDEWKPVEPVKPEKSEPQPELKTSELALEKSEADLLSLEGIGEKPRASKPEVKKEAKEDTKRETKPETKQEMKKVARQEPAKPMDTSIPSVTGRSASFVRPPGITRSGLNDQFARNVIRALQQTMPRLSNTLGRATIRIILDQNGNISTVDLVNPAKDPSIGQNVVFAARQTSFPIPPGGSNLADRTFLITYIYD